MLRRKPFKFFNPRLREGGDLKIWRLCIMHQIFNPRLREGGDECFSIRQRKQYIFNPRLREGGDVPFAFFAKCLLFSIHASAKEATNNNSEKRVTLIFSIHASAKEATCLGVTVSNISHLFNPRLREGGDKAW